MAFPIALNEQEYSALVALARKGTVVDGAPDPNEALKLDAFLKDLEERNGIKRSAVWVQWQEADQPLPPSTDFPENWPPSLRFFVELVTRPVSRDDIDKVLAAHAKKPINVLLTKDPAGLIGWTEIDKFFIN
jgi:hypothetical protein